MVVETQGVGTGMLGGPVRVDASGPFGVGRDDRGAGEGGTGSPPRLPVRPAPASFGQAGLSAGEGFRVKQSIEGWEELAEPQPGLSADRLATGLGWFSIALGVAELAAGKRLCRCLGTPQGTGLARLFGLREIATGAAILCQTRPRAKAPYIWGRVAGDAMDLAALGAGLDRDNPKRANVAGAMAVVGAVTAVDLACAAMLGRRK